jgi:hypothetical protein
MSAPMTHPRWCDEASCPVTTLATGWHGSYGRSVETVFGSRLEVSLAQEHGEEVQVAIQHYAP